MWQIHIVSGNVKEVFGKSSDFITLNVNEVQIRRFAYMSDV